MLDELLAELDAPDHEGDVFLRLESASRRGDALELELRALIHYESTTLSRWRVRCSDVVDYTLAPGRRGISFHEFGHVAARQHTDSTCALMFRNAPSSIPAFIGKLWLTHKRIAGPWIPFERYFNDQMRLDALLEAGSGVLAGGPVFLIEAYAEAIADMGVGEYLTDVRLSRFGDAARLGTLILEGTVVVAHDFLASRVDA